MSPTSLSQATVDTLINIWENFLSGLASVIPAIIVFTIGWFVAVIIGSTIAKVLKQVKFNSLVEKGGWKRAMDRAEVNINPSEFIGGIVKWVIIITFLMVSVEMLGSVQFANFLGDILAYIPNVLVALLIFVVTVVVVDILSKIVKTTVEKSGIKHTNFATALVRWSIWIFAGLIILEQLGIAESFMQILFSGVVATLAIALGLSFGLGGKNVAQELLEKLKRQLADR